MKLLFSCTGPLIKDKVGNYYSRTITDEVLSRYFLIADNVSIYTRVKEVLDEEELKKFTKIKSEKFQVIKYPNLLTFRGFIFEQFKARRLIKKVLLETDKVIVRLPDIAGNFVVNLAKKLYKPYLLEVVGCPWDTYWNHSLKGKLIAPFMWLLTKKIVKNATHVIYVTDEFLQHRYPCNGKTIGCSDVSLPPIDENILKRRLDKIKNMSNKKAIVLGTTAATNVRYKGQQYVIKAISKLNKQGYNFEYHLAGGGDNSYLKFVAKKFNVIDKVKFLSSLPHDKVFKYLDNIDIYIQPSMAEGSPRALIEAMSRACIILGSCVGGIPELFNKAFVFRKRSVDDICQLLTKINKNIMIEEAKTNYNNGKQFQENLLESRKNGFLIMFANCCSKMSKYSV